MESKFAAAASLWQTQLNSLIRKYPSERFELDNGITSILLGRNIRTTVINNVLQVEKNVDKIVEVPVQDTKTKNLIRKLATEMKRITTKYPQLIGDIDKRLLEYVSDELIEQIEVDELDRIVEIVKYVPDVVRVDNVYTYSSEKTKRVEYHLRVLIKALLLELEKASKKVTLETSESLLAMIREEIGGIVDVEDVLRVFTVIPKIVEVEKIVEKVVERVVEVPQIVPVEKVVEKVVEVPKMVEVEKVIHVPVEVIKVVEKIV